MRGMTKTRELTQEEQAKKERKETPIEIDVTSNWQPWYMYPLRLVLMMLGVPMLLLGCFMMITIILIIPGMGIGMLGLLMLAGACMGIQNERCLECEKKTYLVKFKKEQECMWCRQKYSINWTAKFIAKRELKERERLAEETNETSP